MTFHRAMNYGARLQAFALSEVLSERHDVSIIDYKCDYIDADYYKNKNLKKSIKSFIKLIIYRKHELDVRKKNERFKAFNNDYIHLTGEFTANTIDVLNSEFDVFMSGSDQVWNTRITQEDWNYFLTFAENTKKFSYAASFGGSFLEADKREQIRDALSTFKSILIRENTGVDILTELGLYNEKVKVVADPVFLLSKEKWIQSVNLKQYSGDYILVYIVAKQTNLINYVNQLARKEGLPIYWINLYGELKKCPDGFIEIADAGPKEFLEWILNAKYVVTTSFHALAFALIFNKPFYYELNTSSNNNNSRLQNLADIFKINDREITDQCYKPQKMLEWNLLNGILEEYKVKSTNLLWNSLSVKYDV